MPAATPKFIAGAMLGRLATWLRLLGLDVVCDPHCSDVSLLRRAFAEGRILLTRDTRMLRRRHLPPYLYIQADDFRAQLRQVVEAYAIDPSAHCFERCARCNVTLTPLARAAVRGAVPPYVWATQTRFSQCPRCQRIYWPATHVDRMRAELSQLPSA